jgi:hypothetical protein
MKGQKWCEKYLNYFYFLLKMKTEKSELE